jgi:UDP-N-acetylmuramyl pentapeptide phosphotransferase/UDP-N-acetylglucosamine-1-phosphate transferase
MSLPDGLDGLAAGTALPLRAVKAMTFVIHFELICHRIFFVVAGLFDRNSDTRTSGY